MKRLVGWYFLVGVLLLATQARAETNVPAFLTARGAGSAGTRAIASGDEATFLNPAALALTRQYTIQLDYAHDTAPSSQLTSGDGIAISISDSSTNPRISTGIAYRYVTLHTNGTSQRGSVTDFAVGTPISNALLAGVRMSYLSYTNGGQEVKTFTGDLGAVLNTGSLVFDVVGFNLLTVSGSDAPRGISGGVAYMNGSSLSIGGDVRWQFLEKGSVRSYAVGGEYIFNRFLPIRLGFLDDSVINNRFITAGSGFTTQTFGFDVSFRRDLTTKENSFVFGIKIIGA